MTRLICAAALAFMPQYAMAQDFNCATTWAALTAATPLQTAGAAVREADDKVCIVDLPNGQLVGIPVDDLTFQVSAADDDMTMLTVALGNMAIAQTQYSIIVEMRHNPAIGGDAFARVTGASTGGSRFAANIGGDLAAFDSAAAAQTALAGVKVSTIDAEFIVTPDLLNTLGIDLSDLSRSTVSAALRGISQSQIPDASRREFLRFAGATPNAQGALAVTLTNDDGLGVLQVISTFANLPHNPSDAAVSDAIARVMSGTALTMAWKPGRR